MHKKQVLIGAHMSISGGIENSITAGESIDCTCIQIFTHSNRQWQVKSIKKEEIQRFKEFQKKSNIKIVVVHASYLINIGSPNKETLDKSKATLLMELEHCEQLDIPYLIMHPGAATGSSEEDCLNQISEQLSEIIETTKNKKTIILLENTAGQGSNVGYKFEHLAQIINKNKHKKRLGVCFDTCHAFTAGYDFRTEEEYKIMWMDFDKTIGFENLKVIHMNDSKSNIGSSIDRHENIGEGQLGLEAFRLIMNDKNLLNIPKILETPKGDNWQKDDEKNLNTLIGLIKK